MKEIHVSGPISTNSLARLKLDRISRSVQIIWNYLNDLQEEAWKRRDARPGESTYGAKITRSPTLSYPEMFQLLKGAERELGVRRYLLIEIARSYSIAYRKKILQSGMPTKVPMPVSGWIPMIPSRMKIIGRGFRYSGIRFRIETAAMMDGVIPFVPYPTALKDIRKGYFYRDSHGEFAINLSLSRKTAGLPAYQVT